MTRVLVPPVVALAMTLAVYGMYLRSLTQDSTIPGRRVAGMSVGGTSGGELKGQLARLEETLLDRPVELVLGSQDGKDGQRFATTWRALGGRVDTAQLEKLLAEAGKSGEPQRDLAARALARRGKLEVEVPLQLDNKQAIALLAVVKTRLDRPPMDARLDLEKKQLVKEQDGYLMNVYPSLAAVQDAAKEAPGVVTLAGVVTRPRLRAADLGDLDISTVISSWETKYSVSANESDRTYNLKVGASKVDGTILRPGEEFSFNAKTGDRTEKEGFRVAPVIQQGELIDGLAGGMCQVATTLHAAAWFAGLEIVSSRPHSRPSSYMTMGLDSTVVYPSVDLKLKNPFDFPIVIHYTVAQGKMRVELLGKQRVYSKVTFERTITQEVPFEHQTRPDPKMPTGQRIIDQNGYPGYHLIRRRTIFDGDKVVKTQSWPVKYPATAEIVRIGTGPATLKKVPEPHHHAIPPVNGRTFLLALPEKKKEATASKAKAAPKKPAQAAGGSR
jgi:vancomycin resistance protein YoaR